MNKDSNTTPDEIVPYITKEEFQNKIKSKYHSRAELNSAFDEAKRNGSFFQLMKASGKKLIWHTIQGDNVQPEDILKQFSRSAIKSARASDVPEGAIVLKEKESHLLSLSNLAIGAIAAGQLAIPRLMSNGLHAFDDGWENSYKKAFHTLYEMADHLPTNVAENIANGPMDVVVENAKQFHNAYAIGNSNMAIVGAIAATTAAAALLSKKPWSAASKFTFADGKALDRANDIIQETAKLMDKEFLERKQNPEKRYYIDKDSVKAFAADYPAEAAKRNPGDMLDGQNWILYVKETSAKKVPNGAVEVKLDPKSGPVLKSILSSSSIDNIGNAFQARADELGHPIICPDNAFSFPSNKAYDQCKDLMSRTLSQSQNREADRHILAAAR